MTKYEEETQMIYLTPEHIIRIQTHVESEQNHMVNETSLYAITAKFFQGYFDSEDPIDVAMMYFEDVVNKHIFGNGNKRTAIIAALAFLEMNGYRTKLETNLTYDAIMAYFAGKDTSKLKAYITDNYKTRQVPNPSLENLPYHLDRLLSENEELLQKLSLT
jgi:death-on-curing protein